MKGVPVISGAESEAISLGDVSSNDVSKICYVIFVMVSKTAALYSDFNVRVTFYVCRYRAFNAQFFKTIFLF